MRSLFAVRVTLLSDRMFKIPYTTTFPNLKLHGSPNGSFVALKVLDLNVKAGRFQFSLDATAASITFTVSRTDVCL